MQYGPDGDDCYQGKPCIERCSRLRRRAKNIAAHRYRRQGKAPQRLEVPQLDAPARPQYHAQFVRWGAKTRTHAIAAQVYDGKELAFESGVQHTEGIGDARLGQWRDEVAALIKARFGCEMATVVNQPRELCPLCRERNAPKVGELQ